MTTYHLSIHKSCSSPAGLPTFTTQNFQLNGLEDFEEAKRLCLNEKNMAGFWKVTVLPIRTNHLSDLLFPVLIHRVLKTESVAEECFSIIGAIVWDLLFLPIRLITYLPRRVYNDSVAASEHPLVSYLQQKNALPTYTSGGEIQIQIYSRRELVGGRVRDEGQDYRLHLSDREIPYPLPIRRASFMNGMPSFSRHIHT